MPRLGKAVLFGLLGLLVLAAGLAAATPFLESEGYQLPWSGQPRPAYLLRQSAESVRQGELLGIVVSSNLRRPLASVAGKIAGLPGLSELAFADLGDRYAALVPVASSAKPGEYRVELAIEDHRQRQFVATATFMVTAREFPAQYIRMTADQTALLTEQKRNEDRAKVEAAKASPTPRPLWSGAFRMPVEGRLTTDFGFVRYVNGALFSRHTGLDISAPEGTPVLAANSGRVTFAGALHASGNTVIIDHGLGLYSAYNHLSRLLVTAGLEVAAGQTVGEVGSTGFSTGPHLHFTLSVGAVSTDPWPWLARDPLEVTAAGAATAGGPRNP